MPEPTPTKGDNMVILGPTAQVYVYFAALLLLITFATPGGALVDIPASFILKNQLHAPPETVSNFRLLVGIPVYFSFIFGLTRDRWSPFGLGDRGQLLLFAPLTALVMVWLAFAQIQVASLTLGILIAVFSFRMVSAGYEGLVSLIGQERLMPGRLSTLLNVGATIALIAATWVSGWASTHLQPRELFLVIALFGICLGLFGLWKPRAVFDKVYDKPQARHGTFWADVKRLLRHRAIYPAISIFFLWNFAPAGGTPLQYYLTNDLHLDDASFANFSTLFNIAGIPTFLLYGFLCKRIPQNKLLLYSTIVAVPQWLPILFVHSTGWAVYVAIPIGFMGGLASAAYVDLNIRSCPAGLQGTLMMLAVGLYALSGRGGDRVGAWIFSLDKANGFLYCAIATTAVYALMLPLLLLIPKNLIATRDGEANAEFGA